MAACGCVMRTSSGSTTTCRWERRCSCTSWSLLTGRY
jgi:hypothetical protein